MDQKARSKGSRQSCRASGGAPLSLETTGSPGTCFWYHRLRAGSLEEAIESLAEVEADSAPGGLLGLRSWPDAPLTDQGHSAL